MNNLIIRWAVVFTLGLLFSWCPAGAEARKEAGLLAHYTFDEGGYNTLYGEGGEAILRDTSGNGINGVIHNAEWVKTAGGGALKFARTDSYVDLGVDLALELAGDMSIVTWVKLEAEQYPGVNTNWTIVDCESYKKSGFLVRVDGHNAKLYYRSSQEGVSQGRSSAISLANSSFYHIAVTRSADTVTTYINGTLEQQLSALPPAPGSAPFLISGKGQSFEGLIDDLKIYKRALDAGEIASVYEEEAAGRGAPQKMITRSPIKAGPALEVAGFALRVGPGGGMQVKVGSDLYFVESSYSYPGESIGHNHLSEVNGGDDVLWKPAVSSIGGDEIRVTASGRFTSLERRLKIEGHRATISDTLANTGDEDVGVIVRNVLISGKRPTEWLLCGVPKTAWANSAANPTVLLAQESSALGAVADDDISRSQFHASAASNQAAFRLEHLGLPAGKSITLEWDLYPLTVGEDYWTFINRIRQDWEVNFEIPGPADMIHVTRQRYWRIYRDKQALSAYLTRTRLKLVQVQWLDFNNHNVRTGGLVSREEFKEMMGEVKETVNAVDPDLWLLGSIEAPYVTLPRALCEELYAARPLTKTTYGEFDAAQMEILRSSPHVWARWKDALVWSANNNAQFLFYSRSDLDGTFMPMFALTVYPAVGNGQHDYMMEQARFIVEEAGIDGVYIDNLNCGLFSYDKWDGVSVDIDSATGAITSRYTDCRLAGAEFRKELIEYILRAGKACMVNGHAVSRHTRSLAAFRFDEFFSKVDPLSLSDGEKPPLAAYLCQAHLSSPIGLGFKPDALGEKGAENYAKVIMKAAISYLRHGVLYCHYETMIPETGPGSGEYGPFNHMFPITPVRLGAGFVEGEERIVTCVSKSFNWPKETSPKVLLFDITGRSKPHEMTPVKTEEGWRVSVALADWQEIAVLEK